jgi:hypothetical protein
MTGPGRTTTAGALLVILLLAPVGAAGAKPHLRDVAEIDDGILYIAIANEIRKTCDDIQARMIRALTRARGLHNRAKALGYSDAEIEAYLESKDEKNRMRRRGAAYLAQHGASQDRPESLCRLGRDEIERNSAIGVLLRAN